MLFDTYKLSNDLTLANRIVMAPLTRARAGQERIPNDLMATYYAQRAGAGLIISEATSISRQGLGWVNSPGIYTDEMLEGWKKITHAVHQKGGKIFLQLWHCGRASHTDFHPELGLPVSASNLPIQGDQIHTPLGKKDYEAPRPLGLEEISLVIADYQHAAQRAMAAGFDGVEIHSANGYLLDQFLQDKTNHRIDEYGGSVENRARLLLEVVDAVKFVVDNGHVGVRISPNGGFNDMGDSDSRKLFFYVAEQLNHKKLAYLHIMDGLGFGFHGNGEPLILAEFRAHFKGTIIGNVGYDKNLAEKRIQDGDADLIAFGRPFITNPDLVERLRHNYPLTDFSDMSAWYSENAEGYTTYPAYNEQMATSL